MQSKATSVTAYLAELPADRRAAIEAVRKVILDNLDHKGGLVEGVQYGMIGYAVSKKVYPAGYHCDPTQPVPYAGLASQKNFMALYLMCLYLDKSHHEWFTKEWAKTGKKVDIGKSCIRFKKVDDLPLELIGQAIRRVTTAEYLKCYLGILNRPRDKGSKPAKSAKSSGPAKSAKSVNTAKAPVAKRKARS